MTNAQMYLAIGIPSFLVILSMLQANMRLTDLRDALERRLDKIEGRLTRIEDDQKQFFTITGRMDGRIDELFKQR